MARRTAAARTLAARDAVMSRLFENLERRRLMSGSWTTRWSRSTGKGIR